MSEIKKHNDSFKRDDVIKIINTVIDKAQGSSSGQTVETLFEELHGLKAIIEDTRSDIRSAGASDISSKHIPTATDELDAIVEATETATGGIMDACENLQGLSGSLADKEGAAKIEAEVTRIFEACSFQDITGQRISKVVSSLQQIEEKVNSLMSVLGYETDASVSPQSPDEDKADVNDEQSLLNGPQDADKAISQDDIDKLLADFD